MPCKRSRAGCSARCTAAWVGATAYASTAPLAYDTADRSLPTAGDVSVRAACANRDAAPWASPALRWGPLSSAATNPLPAAGAGAPDAAAPPSVALASPDESGCGGVARPAVAAAATACDGVRPASPPPGVAPSVRRSAREAMPTSKDRRGRGSTNAHPWPVPPWRVRITEASLAWSYGYSRAAARQKQTSMTTSCHLRCDAPPINCWKRPGAIAAKKRPRSAAPRHAVYITSKTP